MALELTITALAQGGDGVARHGGKVVFVPLALPGERVRAAIVEPGRRFDRARLVAVLEPAPERVAPACAVYGECGGCQFQHVAYATELRLKGELVREACARIPAFDPERAAPMAPSPHQWGYRSRVQVHVHAGRAGFRRRRSHELVPAAGCPIADPRLQPLLAALQTPAVLERFPADADVRLELRTGTEDMATQVVLPEGAMPPDAREALESALRGDVGGSVRVVEHGGVDAPVEWIVDGRALAVRPGGFMQANHAANEQLVAYVDAALEAAGHAPALADLFCGAGNLALSCAARYTEVIGIDDEAAVADAQANARAAGLTHCRFVAADLHRARRTDLKRWVPAGAHVVFDPPRGGAKRLVPLLAARGPAVIAYVSCDPPAFARDAGLLHEAGYRLESVQPFDLFPKTADVELVGLFRPRDA